VSSGPLYIVVAACLGYAFCQRCHVLRYAIARKSGWYAYLHVTSFGGLVLLCGALLQRGALALIDHLDPVAVARVDAPTLMFIRDAVTSALLATLACLATNARIDRSAALDRAWKDDLNQMLYEAIERDAMVTVHLDTGKVFAGFVLDTFEPSEESSYITLLPVWVGHEHERTMLAHKDADLNADALNAYVHGDAPLDRATLTAVTIPRERIAFCQNG